MLGLAGRFAPSENLHAHSDPFREQHGLVEHDHALPYVTAVNHLRHSRLARTQSYIIF